MSILEDEGFILKIYPFEETDGIVNLLTKTNGKIRLMCRGLKRLKNRLHGILSPFNIVTFQYRCSDYDKLGRLYDASLVRGVCLKPFDLSDYYYLSYIAEVILSIEIDPVTGSKLFRLIHALTSSLIEGYSEHLLLYFHFWILKLEGMQPDPLTCGRCQKSFTKDFPPDIYDPRELIFLCKACAQNHHGEKLIPAKEIFSLFEQFLHLPPAKVVCTHLNKKQISRVISGYASKIAEISGKKSTCIKYLI